MNNLDTMSIKNKTIEKILDFYLKSSDFNGIPLSTLAVKLNIEYIKLLSVINELIEEEAVSVQDGENPHIVRWGHYDKETQLNRVKEAEKNEVRIIHTINPVGFNEGITPINITLDSHLLCAYPSPTYLKQHYTDNKYDSLPFTKRLAYGEAQVKPAYFEIDVLERYFSDPRYHFDFEDYSGQISVVETLQKPSLLRETDQVFLKTFGLGYDESGNRVAVAYLRYLSDLSAEHQAYWNSKIITTPCNMVNEYYQNTIIGSWVFSQSLFSAAIEEHRIANEMSQLITGKSIFRETFEGDKRPKEFTFFTSATLVNYENFISLLDKMISDNINKDFFKGVIEEYEMVPISDGVVERKSKGTLRLLEEWLRDNYHLKDETGYEKLMAPFKEVRKERQKPAHKISENYYDKNFFKKQMDFLGKVYQSLSYLRLVFQKHPSCAAVEIPKWIQEGKIKNF
ncbi:MAG: hypothetical protein V4547_09555 [Bacteroidota bacterium]